MWERLGQLTAEDAERFLRFGWGPSVALPHDRIHHAIEQRARATPDAVAVEHGQETISYAALDRQANRIAALLAARGVRTGDNVALFTHRSIPMVVGLLAALKVGAAYVPQDPRIAPPDQLRHVMEVASTSAVLTSAEYADQLPARAGVARIALDALMAEPFDDELAHRTFTPPVPIDPDAGCYVLFTSGTTGLPNGVRVTHRNVCNILLTGPGDLGIRPGWRVGQILNIAFDMAAWEILGCLSHGGTLVIRGRDIAATVERVDVVIATPSILASIDPRRCAHTKVVAVAGEPCPRTLADQWASKCTFYNGCGPTETTIVNTMQPHHPDAERFTIGRPTPNNTVYVLDEHGRPCRIGDIGEMWAGGDCVSAGYLRNPALNAQRYRLDPFLGGDRRMFRTRDLVRWTPDGELEHFGRSDDQVKIRGFRVELDSVSAVLESLPGCSRAVTLKIEDVLVAFVAPHVDAEVAKQAVAAALPYYCTPSFVYSLPVLPHTSRGKIDKAALRLLASAGADGPVARVLVEGVTA